MVASRIPQYVASVEDVSTAAQQQLQNKHHERPTMPPQVICQCSTNMMETQAISMSHQRHHEIGKAQDF